MLKSKRCETASSGACTSKRLRHSPAAKLLRRERFVRCLRGAVLASGLLGSCLSGSLQAQQMPTLPGQSQQQAAPQNQSRLQVYNVPSEYVGSIGAELQLQYKADSSVRVTTDPKTGQLMIMAPESVHRLLSQQINTFLQQSAIGQGDRGTGVASTKQQTYTLKNLSWRELEDAIGRLAGPRMTVTTERQGELANLQVGNPAGLQDILQVDRRLNEVTLLGSGPSVAGWLHVIYSLDNGQVDATNATHVVPLSPAEPRRVRRAIQLVKATIPQDQSGGQTEAQVTIDDEGQATAMGSIDSLGTNSGLFGDVQIEFIEEIDLVIIRGSKRDVQRTLEVIEKIKKQATETQPEVEVYPLEHANAEAVEALVTELYENIYAPRQGSVSITALGQPNALLLIGRKEVVQSVKELVSKIDQPLDPKNQLKVIRLLNASSVDIQDRIREFFVQNPPDGDQRVALGTRVKVLADYRTNSLIIQASPREMVEVEKLIAELDVENATAENSVEVFRLKNSLAEDLQTVLQDIIGGQTTGADESLATPPSGKLSLLNVDGGKIESGILAGVIITADPSVNALVVRAPAQSMGLIAKLIEELDQLPGAEAIIKVFQLQNGDATTMAQTLQGLFGLAVNAGQGAQGNFLNSLSQAALTTGGESSLVQLQIAAEARTNSVIVSGSKSDLTVIEALVLRLDEDVLESRRTEVLWLRNATAADVATAVTGYFDQLAQAQQNLSNGINQIISQQELVNRRVFVVSDLATNSLLVSASPEYFDTAMRLIERLDRRPPMVSIQIMVAEIQLDDGFELGAEWGLQDGLLFDRGSATAGTLSSPVFNLGTAITAASPGAGIANRIGTQGLSSFGVGRTTSAGAPGGFVLSASSEAVGVLVRALQTSGRLQILNRPQLTTLDQQEATAIVGQLVPRISGITGAQLGVPPQPIIGDQQVGLILTVLPRVSPDGLILLQVGVENSNISDLNAGVPIGFGADGQVIRSPIINQTRADTVVSAYSGQTVVFAGLISKTRNSARSQIPILGSLPLIGAAFRFDVETEQRRELMVVLTPRLIQTDDDYDMLKQVETSRMSWCLADVLNMHGDVGLSGGNGLWGPAQSSMMYPDRAPTMLENSAAPLGTPGYNSTSPMPMMIEGGYPLGNDNSLISPSDMPNLESSAAASPAVPATGPVFRPASFSRAPQTGSAGGVQQGSYK